MVATKSSDNNNKRRNAGNRQKFKPAGKKKITRPGLGLFSYGASQMTDDPGYVDFCEPAIPGSVKMTNNNTKNQQSNASSSPSAGCSNSGGNNNNNNNKPQQQKRPNMQNRNMGPPMRPPMGNWGPGGGPMPPPPHMYGRRPNPMMRDGPFRPMGLMRPPMRGPVPLMHPHPPNGRFRVGPPMPLMPPMGRRPPMPLMSPIGGGRPPLPMMPGGPMNRRMQNVNNKNMRSNKMNNKRKIGKGQSGQQPKNEVDASNVKKMIKSNKAPQTKLVQDDYSLEKPWVNDEIKAEHAKKVDIQDKLKGHKNDLLFQQFKEQRDKFVKMYNAAKLEYIGKQPEQDIEKIIIQADKVKECSNTQVVKTDNGETNTKQATATTSK